MSQDTLMSQKSRMLQLLRRRDFRLRVLDTWESPRSGAVYPSGWSIRVPALHLSLEVAPAMADQEMPRK